MTQINSIEDLQTLVVAGFTNWKSLGNVNVKPNSDGSLLLFNYSTLAQVEGRWNYFETISRGLILNAETGRVVARPFDKFHNWMEGGRHSTAKIVRVTEKMDGSLGIMYQDKDGLKIATRGSFDSEQAVWATNFLRNCPNADMLDLTPASWTFLFEIIYPENRIVIDYGGFAGLCLLAIRKNDTGEYVKSHTVDMLARAHGFSRPETMTTTDVDKVLAELPALDGNHEGFVVEFVDGQRFKFKGDQYKALHKAISGLSFKNTLQAVVDGNAKAFVEILPDEFHAQAQKWVDEVENLVQVVTDQVRYHLEFVLRTGVPYDRRSFAQYVKTNCPELSPYMFAAIDDRELRPIILKIAFRDRV